jgi:hypothetical protein
LIPLHQCAALPGDAVQRLVRLTGARSKHKRPGCAADDQEQQGKIPEDGAGRDNPSL